MRRRPVASAYAIGHEGQHHRVEDGALLEQQPGHRGQHDQRARPAAALLEPVQQGPGREEQEDGDRAGTGWRRPTTGWATGPAGRTGRPTGPAAATTSPAAAGRAPARRATEATSCSSTISTTATVQSSGARWVLQPGDEEAPGKQVAGVVLHEEPGRQGARPQGEHQEVVLGEEPAGEQRRPPGELAGDQHDGAGPGGGPPRTQALGHRRPHGALSHAPSPARVPAPGVSTTAATSPMPAPASTSHHVGGIPRSRPVAWLATTPAARAETPTSTAPTTPGSPIRRRPRSPSSNPAANAGPPSTAPTARAVSRQGQAHPRTASAAGVRARAIGAERALRDATATPPPTSRSSASAPPSSEPGLVEPVGCEVEGHLPALALGEQVALHPAVDADRLQPRPSSVARQPSFTFSGTHEQGRGPVGDVEDPAARRPASARRRHAGSPAGARPSPPSRVGRGEGQPGRACTGRWRAGAPGGCRRTSAPGAPHPETRSGVPSSTAPMVPVTAVG